MERRVAIQLLVPNPGEAWREHARCRDLPVGDFYAEVGQDAPGARHCEKCPVRVECLALALRRPERYGCWGGMSERARGYLINRLCRGSVNWGAVRTGYLWPNWDPQE